MLPSSCDLLGPRQYALMRQFICYCTKMYNLGLGLNTTIKLVYVI